MGKANNEKEKQPGNNHMIVCTLCHTVQQPWNMFNVSTILRLTRAEQDMIDNKRHQPYVRIYDAWLA